jgi:predicted anti-sigma-YlaC factor YlaD
MEDLWTDRLSEYLDGELDPAERVQLEEHLAGCEQCTSLLAELDAVRDRARGLGDQPPRRDLWPGIAARLGDGAAVVDLTERRERKQRRIVFTVPQLAAAAAVIVTVSVGGAWLTMRQTTGTAAAGGAGPTVLPVLNAAARSDYDATVSELEHVLAEHRAELDSVTVQVLEENIATIDSALVEIRVALAKDPSNQYLNAHLAQTMLRKVYVLRRAATLVEATT